MGVGGARAQPSRPDGVAAISSLPARPGGQDFYPAGNLRLEPAMGVKLDGEYSTDPTEMAMR